MMAMEIARLIERCRQGEVGALDELYKEYAPKMKGVCRRYVNDEQIVEDVLHDAFVIIFTSLDKLRDVQRAEAWMMAIMRNVASKCKSHLDSMQTVSLDVIDEARMVAVENDKRDSVEVPLVELMGMIDRLPEGYGRVFRLSVFEGMSHKEIADMLGIEPHSSSSQLSRAKKLLHKMMKQYRIVLILLLLMPIMFFLLENDKSVPEKIESATVTKHKDKPVKPQESVVEQPQETVIARVPVRQKPVIVADTMLMAVAKSVDSIQSDTLPNMLVEETVIADTISTDSTGDMRNDEQIHYDMTDLLPDKAVDNTNKLNNWSLQLAYAGQLDELERRSNRLTFGSTVPSGIDNWADYAIYLENNPDDKNAKLHRVLMDIAINNSVISSTNRIRPTSHHQMPVTWSLALKYTLNSRIGLESGLGYSRLVSDFEMGTYANNIHEKQTIHYLGIPLKGIYNIYGGKQWTIYGSLGVTTEIPVSSTLQADYYLNNQYEGGTKSSINAPWQFSTTFGVGLQFHITDKVGFFVEPSLQYYIPTNSDIETYRTEHPLSFSLPLGVRFTW